jgi:hypothetical protein
MILQSANLFFQSGGSDKEYHIQLTKHLNSYCVDAQWGRRGGPLQAQTKLTVPAGTTSADGAAALHEAEKLYAKVLNEKLAKGYHSESGSGYHSESGSPMPVPAVSAPSPVSQTQSTQATAQIRPRRKLVTWDDDDELIVQRIQNFGPAPVTNTVAATTVVAPGEKIQTGNIPQLPNMIDEQQANDLIDLDEWDHWGMQEKMDGNHVMVDTREGIKASNKKGILKVVSPQFLNSIQPQLDGKPAMLLDGEQIGNNYYVYDLLHCDGEDLRPLAYEDRLDRLARYFPSMGSSSYPAIQVVPMYVGIQEKREAFNRFKAEGREGVVFKRLKAPFTAGRPNSGGDMLKHKFYATASVRVSSRETGKRSVGLELATPPGAGSPSEWIDMGNVTIPANRTVPQPGDIVEVRYLYAFRGGKMFQTTYLGPRDDIDTEECLTTQLKYKREED